MVKVGGPARPGEEAAPVGRRGTGRPDCRLVSTEGTPDLWKMLGWGGAGDLFVDGSHYEDGEPRHADYAGDSRRARDDVHPGPVRAIVHACDKGFVDALKKMADSIHDHHRMLNVCVGGSVSAALDRVIGPARVIQGRQVCPCALQDSTGSPRPERIRIQIL